MKKNNTKSRDGEMRAEYERKDLGKGVRGKNYRKYRAGMNLALLAPDVREAYPTDESVNRALRAQMAKH